MKELEYPFDAAYIIKKRKSLKKALLADGTSRIRKKIAVFGGSTTSDIVKTPVLSRNFTNPNTRSIFRTPCSRMKRF